MFWISYYTATSANVAVIEPRGEITADSVLALLRSDWQRNPGDHVQWIGDTAALQTTRRVFRGVFESSPDGVTVARYLQFVLPLTAEIDARLGPPAPPRPLYEVQAIPVSYMWGRDFVEPTREPSIARALDVARRSEPVWVGIDFGRGLAVRAPSATA